MSDDMTLNAVPSPECEALVDARLADYLDDAPDPALVAEVNAHVAGCARCAALVGDLTGITATARALPPLQPSRDLWAGIADRIAQAPTSSPAAPATAAAVVSIDSAPSRRRRLALPAQWRSLGAAAAALVIVTAGATYMVTKAQVERAGTVASQDVNPPKGGVITGPKAPTGELVSNDGAGATRADSATDSSRASSPESATAGGGTTRLASDRRLGRPTSATASAKATYDSQIDALRRIVRERRSQLDPATLAVLERNIAIIDEAIAQSRAALAHDPHSRFLDDQLNSALDKKLDLLRTAALLPART